MDSLGLKRAQMFALLDRLLDKSGRKENASQIMLFEHKEDESVPELEEWTLDEILTFEKALLGIYVSGHPLSTHSYLVNYLERSKILDLTEANSGSEVIVCGVLEKVKIITTKKNDRMAIVRLEDETAGLDVLVFPKLFAEISGQLNEKSIVVLKGKLEAKDKDPKILASKIIPVEQVMPSLKGIKIFIDQDRELLAKLKEIFVNNRGNIPVYFMLKASRFQGITIKTAQELCLNPTDDNLKAIAGLVGEGNLSLAL
jgi:DNA polymerase-3 subunit alpha